MEAEVPFPVEGINGYSDAGTKEMGNVSNVSICPKSPETAIGFKVAKNLVGKRSITEGNVANGITEGGQSEAAAEIAEYDIEEVLQKQETHDLFCPNCRSCITERVILRRRKRKAPEISPDKEGNSSTPGLTILPARGSVVEPSSSGCCFEAFTCFSCLHVIFPNGLWFPFGIFGAKPEDVIQLGNAAVVPPQDIDPPVGFSMWILTCCQPSMDLPKNSDGSMIVPQQPQKPRGTRLPLIGPSDDPLSGTDPEAQPILHPNEHPARRGVSGYDIIKAIVYGGLLEIIASLSVVSSAAGGDATTLNIVTVGLANVFGGLVVLFHNLRILKNEHVSEHYQEQLGRRSHFPVHATIAVLSYLVFGMMPPLVYGFSFRESNDKNSKLIALAVASLVSITVLSIGKAYVRNPPKGYWKTIMYYFSSGFMVSGLGFVAGQLTNKLLKKLGLFEPSSPASMSMATILGAGAMKSSY